MATPTALNVLSSHMTAMASLGMCAKHGLPTDEAKDIVRQTYVRRVTKGEVEHLMSNINPVSIAVLRALGFIPCPVTSDTPDFFIPAMFLESFDDGVVVKDADGKDVRISEARGLHTGGFTGTTAFFLHNLSSIEKPVETTSDEKPADIDWGFMGFDDGYHERE